MIATIRLIWTGLTYLQETMHELYMELNCLNSTSHYTPREVEEFLRGFSVDEFGSYAEPQLRNQNHGLEQLFPTASKLSMELNQFEKQISVQETPHTSQSNQNNICGDGTTLKDGVCIAACSDGTVFKDGKCEIVQESQSTPSSDGGGCLIATAAFGSEMAPQVQFLREIRDNTVMTTESGTAFMTGFNQFYYSFSPYVADYERENPVFKEAVKVTLTPLLTSLTLLNYVDVDTEEEMLGYGIGIILLNVGMYFVAPVILVISIKNPIKGKSIA